MRYCFLFLFLVSFGVQAGQWKKVHEENGIAIEAYEGDDRIIPFKATAILDLPVQKVVATLRDWKHKHLWSPKLKSVRMHKELGNDEYIFSELYKTPWPATDREFLLRGKIEKISKNKYLFSAHSVLDEKLADDGHIQCDVKTLEFLAESLGPEKTRVVFEFHGDMKGWMPAWLINIIQKKWPMRFIEALSRQVRETAK